MKLEENMYVRTKYGTIAKIEYIEDNTAFCDNWLWQSYEEYIDFINLKDEEDVEDIIKASFNIIDILEVGDFLDNHCISNIENDTCYLNDGWFINADDIENLVTSICTKEQFEQMSYKLGE